MFELILVVYPFDEIRRYRICQAVSDHNITPGSYIPTTSYFVSALPLCSIQVEQGLTQGISYNKAPVSPPRNQLPLTSNFKQKAPTPTHTAHR